MTVVDASVLGLDLRRHGGRRATAVVRECMLDFDRTLPPALAEANAAEYDFDSGVDFLPFDQFLDANMTTAWIRAWTGNYDLDGSEYRLFGKDGSGGYAAFWLARDGASLIEQPIAFFGSEGERGIVARHLGDYLWLIAGGLGPREAIGDEVAEARPVAHLAALAARHAPEHEKSAAEVVRLAREEFPDFEDQIGALVR